MSILSTVGDSIVKGAKFVFEHRKEFEEVAHVATDAASVAADMKKRRQEAKNEKEYYAAVEEENVQLKETISDISQGITDLENLYNNKIWDLESNLEALSGDFIAAQERLSKQVEELGTQLSRIEVVQGVYQKKMDLKWLITSACAGVGIVVSIVLSILL